MSPARLAETIGDEASRVRLGAHADTPPEVLYFLAADPCVTVRAAVAMNKHTPTPANALLANDADDRVRAVLGRKIALIAAGLDGEGQERLERVVRSLLASLVLDTAERVRAMIADTMKEMPNAPTEIIRQLAHDTSISVADPIIRFSPLLSERDLLQLLALPPCPGVANAVARRAGISELVSDAVVATGYSSAIRDLLGNHSAAIREATLDALVAVAAEHQAWHEPFVRRPALSAPLARALSLIVADHLLATLAERGSLDPVLRDEIKARVAQRLSAAPEAPASASDAVLDQVMALERAGKLSEHSLIQALAAANEDLVAATLAVAANVPLAVVERARRLRSAKAIVAIIWRAGFSMKCAVGVQTLLAHLPPTALLGPLEQGRFPLSPDEMRWQIDFLENARD